MLVSRGGRVWGSMGQGMGAQGMGQSMGQGMSQQPGMPPRSGALPGGQREREVIWKGELEWQEKVKDGPGDQKISHSVACSVSSIFKCKRW